MAKEEIATKPIFYLMIIAVIYALVSRLKIILIENLVLK